MKIAYFGSDWFSAICFRALDSLRTRKPGLISQLDLVTRQLKPSGRGQSQIQIPEIVHNAHASGLAHYEVETSADFAKVANADLAVAVSYGRLIPAEYLKARPLGGINVHPSLLPQYRGAAPLQRAIMDRVDVSGVSVQTLHPSKFDRGDVLWQSPPVPLEPRDTTLDLGTRLAHLGSRGLVHVVEQLALGHHLPPIGGDQIRSCWARKIDKAEFKLHPEDTWRDADARGRALGKLWIDHPDLGRVNLSGFVPANQQLVSPEPVTLVDEPGTEPYLAIRCSDGWIGVRDYTAAGSKTEFALSFPSSVTKAAKKKKSRK